MFSFLSEQNQEQIPENREPSVKVNYESEDIPITRPIIYSEYVSGSPPIIEGVLTAGEWTEPAFTKPFQYTVNDDDKVGEIAGHFMNDDDYLYIAITASGDGMQHSVPEKDWVWFTLTLCFDNENDSVISAGEDIKQLLSSQAGSWEWPYYSDSYIKDDPPKSVITSDKDKSGEGTVTFSNRYNSYIFEFQIPLNSGDPYDLAIKAGDTIGIKVRLTEDAKVVGGEDRRTTYSVGWVGWPIAESMVDISAYGKLVLATGSP